MPPPSVLSATDLGTLGGPATVPFDLNAQGVVVGVSDTDIPAPTVVSHAFRWQRGVMTDLTPTADYGVASDVNERGQILVRSYDDEQGERMLLWWCGRMVDLGPSGAAPLAVNARGQVLVGSTLFTPTR